MGTTVVAALGVSGGIVAGLVGGAFPSIAHPTWRVAYFIGGGLGLALLLLRLGVVESGMFHATLAKKEVKRGDFFALFRSRKRLARYLAIIVVGIPVWYVIGIPFQFANELGGALGLDPAPSNATALTCCYGACTIGGLACGLISQKLRSRRRALGGFLAAVVVVMALYFTIGGSSLAVFYTLCAAGGFATGYWAVFMATAAELFGTNLRATATTTVPNFVRGSAVLLTIGLRALQPSVGIVRAAIIVGATTLIVAFVGLFALPETFAVDLDFHEQ
jgi:MFS family permease